MLEYRLNEESSTLGTGEGNTLVHAEEAIDSQRLTAPVEVHGEVVDPCCRSCAFR